MVERGVEEGWEFGGEEIDSVSEVRSLWVAMGEKSVCVSEVISGMGSLWVVVGEQADCVSEVEALCESGEDSREGIVTVGVGGVGEDETKVGDK